MFQKLLFIFISLVVFSSCGKLTETPINTQKEELPGEKLKSPEKEKTWSLDRFFMTETDVLTNLGKDLPAIKIPGTDALFTFSREGKFYDLTAFPWKLQENNKLKHRPISWHPSRRFYFGDDHVVYNLEDESQISLRPDPDEEIKFLSFSKDGRHVWLFTHPHFYSYSFPDGMLIRKMPLELFGEGNVLEAVAFGGPEDRIAFGDSFGNVFLLSPQLGQKIYLSTEPKVYQPWARITSLAWKNKTSHLIVASLGQYVRELNTETFKPVLSFVVPGKNAPYSVHWEEERNIYWVGLDKDLLLGYSGDEKRVIERIEVPEKVLVHYMDNKVAPVKILAMLENHKKVSYVLVLVDHPEKKTFVALKKD